MSREETGLDRVKRELKINWMSAVASLNLPEPNGTKLHDCPICGAADAFRIYPEGKKNAGLYVCKGCGTRGAGFGLIELVARIHCGADTAAKPTGKQALDAARVIDEATGWGCFTVAMSADDKAERLRQSAERKRQAEELQRQRQAEQAEKEAQALSAALNDLSTATPGECLYLTRKGYTGELARLPLDKRGNGLLPLVDIDGETRSLQRLLREPIATGEGKSLTKLAQADLNTAGLRIVVSGSLSASVVILSEGYATGLSIALAVAEWPERPAVMAAINSGGLEVVAVAIRDRFPETEIVIAADNDAGKKGNAGMSHATAAAAAVGGFVVASDNGADWDDMRRAGGAEYVEREFDERYREAKEKGLPPQALSVGSNPINKILDESAAKPSQRGDDNETRASNQPTARQRMSWAESVEAAAHAAPGDVVPVGTVDRVPAAIDYKNDELSPVYRRFYADTETPQARQPANEDYLIELESRSVVYVHPSVKKSSDGNATKEFNGAKSVTIVSGVAPVMRGYDQAGAAMVTYHSTDKERRATIAERCKAPEFAAALRSMGAPVVEEKHISIYRNAWLSQQRLPLATYSNIGGWVSVATPDGTKKPAFRSRYGLLHFVEGVTFEPAAEGFIRDAFEVKGTAEQWRETVGRLIALTPAYVFQLCLELAAPLVGIRGKDGFNAEGFAVCMVGRSGRGKTVGSMAAASVWGEADKLVRREVTSASTKTFVMNHLLTTTAQGARIDDLTAYQSDPRAFGELVYAAANGTGRNRSDVTGANRDSLPPFSCLLMMSAEGSQLEHYATAHRHKFEDGMTARYIEQPFPEVTAPEGYQSTPGKPARNAYFDELSQARQACYGAVGLEYLQGLELSGVEQLRAHLLSLIDSYRNRFEKANAGKWAELTGEKQRAHALYAVAYAAGALASVATGIDVEAVYHACSTAELEEMAYSDNGRKAKRAACFALWEYLMSESGSFGKVEHAKNKAQAKDAHGKTIGYALILDNENHDHTNPASKPSVTRYFMRRRNFKDACREVGYSESDLLAELVVLKMVKAKDAAGGALEPELTSANYKNGNTTSRSAFVLIKEPTLS